MFERTYRRIIRGILFVGTALAYLIQHGSRKIFATCRSFFSSALSWICNRLLELLLFLMFALFPLTLLLIGIYHIYQALDRRFKFPKVRFKFSEVERGKMIPSVDNSMDRNLRAGCFFDCAATPFEPNDEQPTFIIPVLDGYRTSGLIVQLVEVPEIQNRSADRHRYYKRLGVFEMNSLELRKFRAIGSDSPGSSFADETFYLV